MLESLTFHIDVPVVRTDVKSRDYLACSKRSDSGERCEVKKAMKSRGGLGTEVRERSLSHLSPSLAFIFSRSFLRRTAPHYLNAWNRLVITKISWMIDYQIFLAMGLRYWMVIQCHSFNGFNDEMHALYRLQRMRELLLLFEEAESISRPAFLITCLSQKTYNPGSSR